MKIRKTAALAMAFLLQGMAAFASNAYQPAADEPEEQTAQVAVTAQPSAGGTVSGAGAYAVGASVTISASSNPGFVFVNWTDAQNQEVSTDASYAFTKSSVDETFIAHFIYSPGSPGEPTGPEGTGDNPSEIKTYPLTVIATTGGTVSGGGEYQANDAVTIVASPGSGFAFKNWTDENGKEVATEATYILVKKAQAETFTAHFLYSPASPEEPSGPNVEKPEVPDTRTLTVKCGNGGTATGGGKIEVGTDVTLTASPNSGYAFSGWWREGEIVEQSTTYSFTMPDQDVMVECLFTYKPDSPGDPGTPSNSHAFYMLSKTAVPDDYISFPLYFSTLADVTDMTFDIQFPIIVDADWSSVKLGPEMEGYSLDYVMNGEENGFTVTLTGGSVQHAAVLAFDIMLYIAIEDYELVPYPVNITNASITLASGAIETAAARSGFVSILEKGDNNADGLIDWNDKENLELYILTDGRENEFFNKYAADLNEDGEINVLDIVELIKKLKGEE